jgi:diguanylate cyclase (GGDEF)-like protein/PAS domain S-box-containing protein
VRDTETAPLLDVISRAETLEQTVAAIPMAIVVVDLEGRIVLWSGAAEALYGWRAAEVMGRPARPLMVAPDDELRAEQIRVEVQRGERSTGVLPLLRKDGSTFEAFVVNAPVHDAEGRLVGIVGMSVDTGDARISRADQALQESRFRSLVETARDGIWMADRGGRTIFANERMAELLGCSLEELMATSMFEFVPDDDLAHAMAIIDQLHSGLPQRFDFCLRRIDGSLVQVEVATSPIFGLAGEVTGGMATITDVTQQHAAAEAARQSKERLDMALDAGGLAAWDLDLATGDFVMADNLEKVYGLRPASALTFPAFLDRVVPEDRHLFLRRDLEVGAGFDIDYRVEREDGIAWLRSRGRVVGDESGTPVAIRGTTVDITASVRAEQARAEADAVYRETLQAVPDAFIGVDADGLVTDWNPAAGAMFGWSADEAVGSPVDRIFVEEDRPFYRERIRSFATPGQDLPPGHVELIVQHRDGHTFPVELALVVVRVGGEPRLRAFLRDITERRAFEKELADRAVIDQLTGLPNRVLLEDRLARAIARVGSRDVHAAVLFLDVDRMKSVNESLGHAAGDALLVAVADRLRRVVGAEHTVARHGGDEFIVLCEDLPSPDVARRVADAIGSAFAQPLAVAGRRLKVDLSIGMAPVSSGEVTPQHVIRGADIAMHQAKSLGGSRVEVLEPAQALEVTTRLDLEHELRRALATGQITVAYQPVVSFDGRLASVEALARWQHPERGSISPTEFIPVAEETGLIVDLGAHVLDEACARVAEWRARPEHGDLVLAVNLSGRQLVDDDLVRTVETTLERHGLPVGALCLEITESMLMDESSRAAWTVDALAELGVTLSVDDFGTGYSSLLYLRRFPVHALKLDRSFVSGMGTSEVDAAIVGSMIDLAHSLCLFAVAEGVETEEQALALAERGCDLAQGYFFSRPVPAEELGRLLDDGRFA